MKATIRGKRRRRRLNITGIANFILTTYIIGVNKTLVIPFAHVFSLIKEAIGGDIL